MFQDFVPSSDTSNSNQSTFGLTHGMNFDQVKSRTISINPQPGHEADWFSFYPETPDPFYKYYSCQISPEKGLQRICCWTQNIETNPNGAQLYSLFEHLRDHEQKTFGPHRFYHVLKDDALFKTHQEFTLSLQKNERIIMCLFAPEFGSTLPEAIRQIQLQLYVRDPTHGNVMKRIFLE